MTSSLVTSELSPEAWVELVEAKGWSDGLPLACPTESTVASIIDSIGLDPDVLIGTVPPAHGRATVQEIAVQCAMAGCVGPEGPYVVAALRAMLEPAFNLHGMQSTTNPCSPLVVVGGPNVQKRGFNCSHGVFGGGSINVSVGRAVRLVLWNLGNGRPGVNDMAPLGHPGKLAFCVAEHGRTETWRSLQEDLGVEADVDAVTVFACTGPDPVTFSPNVQSILGILAESLASTCMNAFHAAGQVMVVLSTQPARILAEAGWDRASFQQWLWDNARYEMGRLRRFNLVEDRVSYWRASGLEHVRPPLTSLPDDERLPMVSTPQDFLILVTGGDTQMWGGYLAGWGHYGGRAIARALD